jgi:hypothetical protein
MHLCEELFREGAECGRSINHAVESSESITLLRE